jgi:hypothetical protein
VGREIGVAEADKVDVDGVEVGNLSIWYIL